MKNEKDGKITLEQLIYILMMANLIMAICLWLLKGSS